MADRNEKTPRWLLFLTTVAAITGIASCGGSFCDTLAKVAAGEPPQMVYNQLILVQGQSAVDTPLRQGGPVDSFSFVDASGQPIASPLGITLQSGGALAIDTTHIAPGVYRHSVQFTNPAGSTVSTAQITVIPAASLTLGYPDQTFPVGRPIPDQLPQISNATPGLDLTYAFIASPQAPQNVLPPGLELNQSTGVIHGTPTTPGIYTFQIGVDDGPQQALALTTYSINSSIPGSARGAGSPGLSPILLP